MPSKRSHASGYVFAVLLGAIGGGVAVALATNAVPRMMSQFMRRMMDQMAEGGFDPSEI
jgi:hypothetical protein